MLKSLGTLFLVALFLALIIGCSNLGAPVGRVDNGSPETTASVPIETPSEAIEVTMSPSSQEGFSNEVKASTDLDGDGTMDEILLRTKDNPNGEEVTGYVLSVNGKEISYEGENINPLFNIVDLLPEDGHHEIAVSEEGPSNDDATVFFRYKADSLSVIGEIQGFLGAYPQTDGMGRLVVNGDGTVTTQSRGEILQTWFYEDTYRLSDSDELIRVVKDLYPMVTEVTLLKPLKTQVARDNEAPGHTFQVGEKATLLETDNKEWVSIRNEDGEISWFQIKGFYEILGQDEPYLATDIFDGLIMAD